MQRTLSEPYARRGSFCSRCAGSGRRNGSTGPSSSSGAEVAGARSSECGILAAHTTSRLILACSSQQVRVCRRRKQAALPGALSHLGPRLSVTDTQSVVIVAGLPFTAASAFVASAGSSPPFGGRSAHQSCLAPGILDVSRCEIYATPPQGIMGADGQRRPTELALRGTARLERSRQGARYSRRTAGRRNLAPGRGYNPANAWPGGRYRCRKERAGRPQTCRNALEHRHAGDFSPRPARPRTAT